MKRALGAYAAVCFAFLYLPLMVLVVFSFNRSKFTVWEGFSLNWYYAVANNPDLGWATRNSIVIAIVSATVSTAIGTMAAYGLWKRRSPVLSSALYLTLVTPEIVTGISLLAFFQFVFRYLHLQLGLYTVILAHIAFSIAYVAIVVSARLGAMDPALEEASAASGATPLKTFRRVTLPVLLPGLLAPVVLITLITAEQFELPLIIGLPAKVSVFSYRVYFELNPLGSLPNYGAAAALSLPFVLFGVLLLALYNRMIRRSERHVTVTGKAFRQRRLRLGAWRIPALCFVALYVAIAVALPVAVLLWTSFFGYTPPLAATRDAFSLEAYRQLFANRAFWTGLVNTLTVATLSAALVTAIGGLLGWIITRSRSRWRHALDLMSVLSVGIPAVIAGLGVMILHLSLPIGLYGTVWILVLAYSYRFATTTRLARAGLMQIHRELEEASAVAGARWATTQRRILIPLMRPALVTGFVLLFIVGVREFTIPLVLYSQDNVVLSVLLWQLFQYGQPAPSAALACLVIVVVLPVVVLVRRYLTARALA